MTRGRLLVVDDKPNMRRMLLDVLGEHHEVRDAEDAKRALAMLAAGSFDVVVSDIRMPEMDGVALLGEIKREHPDIEVVLITGYASVERAVDAMRAGAYHYLKKPFEPDELVVIVQRALERKRLAERARRLEDELERGRAEGLDRLVGKSRAMQELFTLARRAAASDATVLISGESGTGKELVARAVHAESGRAGRAFVAVNCGALPEQLVESELFGHARGAFTGATDDKPGLFEEAHGGTLFLDEVGDLPLPAQVKLTRVLQEGVVRRVGETRERAVDVRVVAATNVDLKAALADGRFRKDLYYRLNIFALEVPPLRARIDDVPALAASFLARHRPGDDGPSGFTPEALAALLAYPWPGNVRELENAVQRAVAVAGDVVRIAVEHLPAEVAAGSSGVGVSAAGGAGGGAASVELTHREYVDLAKERASREYLVALMRAFSGNVAQAAQRAGTERESLHRLLRKHGVRPADFKGGA